MKANDIFRIRGDGLKLLFDTLQDMKVNLKSHLVSMVPEEDEVALVVKRYDTTTFELRVMREERREHPAYSLSKSKSVNAHQWSDAT